MGMSLGAGRKEKAEINLTPMIDVLLVLIIIFLVISVPSRGLPSLIPQAASGPEEPARLDIVITIRGDGAYQLNQEVLGLKGLQARLGNLVRYGANQVIFVRGDKTVEYARVAEVIDLARGLGVYRIGLMTN